MRISSRAVSAAVMLAAWGWLGLQSARRDLASATAELAAAESTLAASEDARRGLDSVLAGILAPGVQLYQLTASGNPDPVIQLFWDAARRRAVLSGARLPAVAPGRAYQLWFILDGAPVPSVTFEPDAQGRVVVPAVELPGTAAPTAAAITEEPAGGSAQPTTPIILLTTFRQS